MKTSGNPFKIGDRIKRTAKAEELCRDSDYIGLGKWIPKFGTVTGLRKELIDIDGGEYNGGFTPHYSYYELDKPSIAKMFL